MGACLAFLSDCDPNVMEVDERFTHCCDDEIDSITYNKDGWVRLINDLEIISTSIYAIVSEMLLADHQYFLQKAFTSWKCTMSSIGVNLWYVLAAVYQLLVFLNAEAFMTDAIS